MNIILALNEACEGNSPKKGKLHVDIVIELGAFRQLNCHAAEHNGLDSKSRSKTK